MSINAMKQAYQILITEPHSPTACDKLEAILRQAIAEAEKQDGYCQQCGGNGCVACDAREQEPVQVTIKDFVKAVKGKEEIVGRPVYWAQWPNGDTHPQPKREWVGLTDEDFKKMMLDLYNIEIGEKDYYDDIMLFRAVEAKLKELNT